MTVVWVSSGRNTVNVTEDYLKNYKTHTGDNHASNG